MARILELSKPETISTVNGEKINAVETKEIFVLNVSDTGNEVNATIGLSAGPGETYHFELWSGKEYESVGNWTDEEVDAKIKEILNVK